MKKQLKEFKMMFDASEYGGAPLLGLSKPVIKAHGSSKAYDIQSAVKQAKKYYADGKLIRKDYIVCPYCRLRFGQISAKHLGLHQKTMTQLHAEFGIDYQTVSDNTSVKRAAASKLVQQKLIESGKHKGWQSRKITSYAERYWIEVLNAENISYEREVPVKHEKSNYFLDFVIERNGKLIDLEIDGKQHCYEDRAEADIVRDDFLQSVGYLVYRIPWNTVNTVEGRQLMQDKINAFLEFYNSL
jgi:very-short-patch-repair endonuclease